LVDAVCPVCGKNYLIPDGRGREMVVSKFLAHKDFCQLPVDDEFVKVGGRVGIVIDTHVDREEYPKYEVQMPSGRSNVFNAAEVSRMNDQDSGRRIFYD
jgi:hypothetical protein